MKCYSQYRLKIFQSNVINCFSFKILGHNFILWAVPVYILLGVYISQYNKITAEVYGSRRVAFFAQVDTMNISLAVR